MSTTITQSFNRLKENLEITGLQSSTVSTRQRNVREAVENELTVLDSFLTGSYARSTMISPLSEADIDVFIVLDPSYYKSDDPAGLLGKVKRVLRKTYPRTPDISRDGQAVTITFDDFKIDVVPGFNRKGGGFLIPNTQGGTWISTNPKEHVRISSEHNSAHGDRLVPMVKMIKCWNRNINRHFRSFHLEVLAWQIMDGVEITSYAQGIRYFLDKGRTAVATKTPDPSGYGGDIGYYISSQQQIDDAKSRFTTAYNRACQAEKYELGGNVESAVDEWRKIFDSSFPTYG